MSSISFSQSWVSDPSIDYTPSYYGVVKTDTSFCWGTKAARQIAIDISTALVTDSLCNAYMERLKTSDSLKHILSLEIEDQTKIISTLDTASKVSQNIVELQRIEAARFQDQIDLDSRKIKRLKIERIVYPILATGTMIVLYLILHK